MTADSWAQRLYQSLRSIVAWPQFPECRPALRCEPTFQDDEVEFFSDMRYLDDLRDALQMDCRRAMVYEPAIFEEWVARPLMEAIAVPVESKLFWEQWDWPDRAGMLLEQWRAEKEIRATIDAILEGIEEAA